MLDLLDMAESDERVISAKRDGAADPLIVNLISDSLAWHSALLKRHNDASHPLHKISILAELGFTKDDLQISRIGEMLMSHQDPNGPFYTLSNYPTHFGGSGKDEWLWALCDAPLITFSLIKFGYGDYSGVEHSFEYLKSRVRENGWPCAACNQLGKFKGPGKKEDPCPYANLIMLKTLAAAGDTESNAAKIGTKILLGLWENSRNEKPFLFKMGTDFQKLKVPFIWYDILHTIDVLSQFHFIHGDHRFQEMLAVIQSKPNDVGRFTSESIWTKWKGWEFCQKKEPSRWVTLCVLKILKRSGKIGKEQNN